VVRYTVGYPGMGYIVVVVMPWSLLVGRQSVAALRELALCSLCVKRKGKKHAKRPHGVCERASRRR
jgi:hypothetical protein